jgi:oligopeptide/dipeptide ABC transporter ATP-binding protein
MSTVLITADGLFERSSPARPHASSKESTAMVVAMPVAKPPWQNVKGFYEPTSALDVTVQAQIIELLEQLSEERGLAVVLITHDLGVIAEVAHRVAVMYGGRIVETGRVEEIFARPRHPYTIGLLRSLPRIDGAEERLVPISGQPPAPARMPSGCAFHPRCPIGRDRPICAAEAPALVAVGAEGHASACHFAAEAETAAHNTHCTARHEASTK